MRNPYTVLGVTKNADSDAVKSAYRKLAKKFHPDQNPNDPKAKENFAEINQAYEILGDKDKRRQFDLGAIDNAGKPRHAGFEGFGPRPGSAGGRQTRSSFAGTDDMLREFFGSSFGGMGGAGRDTGPTKVADFSFDLHVTLEEAAREALVDAKFSDGRKLSVKLPRGVEDKQVIRLRGQGNPDRFGKRSDALATILIRPHPKFRRDGADLHVELPVSLKQAVFGAKVPVDTLTGKIAIMVPSWSSSDKVLRLRGKGMPKTDSGHGDLLVHVRLMLPTERDPQLETFLGSEITSTGFF
jgi:DnaJ-class molecular chaperone